ncbi:MAG: hypothetical protein KC656_22405, partial [Myxococcales bacterium]|nr:hypothetical protein [Myxococcales bacterium]
LYILVLQEEEYRDHLDSRLAEIDAPPPVLSLLRRMLARTPMDRPSAAEVSSLCDDLADNLDGPNLRRWCKQHDWPSPNLVEGLLDGRTITEATMATTMRADFAREVPRPSRRFRLDWGVVFGTVGTLALAVGVVVGILGVLVAGLAMYNQTSAPVATAIVLPPEPAPLATLDIGELVQAPRSVRGQATAAVAPPPERGQPIVPAARTTITFTTKPSKVDVRLFGGGKVYGNFMKVPPGSYSVQANWQGDGFDTVPGTIQVDGGTTHIECNTFKRTCARK